MTQEKINLIELLKDCPKGMELDCTMFDDVTFVRVDNSKEQFPIEIAVGGLRSKYLTKEGCFHDTILYPEAKCVIFPKGKTTWEGFQRSFKDGDVVALRTPNGTWMGIFKEYEDEVSIKTYCAMNSSGVLNETDCSRSHGLAGVLLASEEERAKLFQAIKDNGYEWNPENKTLEKLIKPKFKVGDRIKWKGHDASGRIEKIEDNVYHVDYGYDDGFIRVNLNMQDDYDLVPNKFDINTLIPFESKVLVRDMTDESWRPAIFGFYFRYASAHFMTVGGFQWKYLIPYEDNEHLMGTNDDCDEFYKTWE